MSEKADFEISMTFPLYNYIFCKFAPMLRKAILFLFLLTVLGLGSCGHYQKLLKSTDNELKYKKSVEYFKTGDYYRALQLFDQLIPIYRGTDKAEMIYYYTSYCYYEQGDYILGSYYFKTFAKNYPNSEYTEECMYMNAWCKFLDSPEYSLDQSSTVEAMQELQLFVNLYPHSIRVNKCNDLLDVLRGKIERKDYEIAKLYYKMGDYQAAITCFKNLYKDFPDSKYKEDILFLQLKAYYNYAFNSVETKKKERYQGALEAYNTFVTFFPASPMLKEANALKKSTLDQINRN
jgi:outer membrane protein assembly factor BamD